MKQVKIKLRSVDTVLYAEEHTQEVKYIYSIEDSIGILEIFLTIPEDADPIEQFVIHVKDLYKGFLNYVVYYRIWKYTLLLNNIKDYNFQLHRIKMW